MRLARIAHPNGLAFVSVEGGDSPADAVAREIKDHPFGTPEFSGRSWPLSDVRLLAPILPSKIVAIGRNYADHAKELGNVVPDEPLIFLKPSTSVIGPHARILLPPSSDRVEHEGELAVVIGRPAREVRAENAESVILGYTVANDVTARDLQKSDGQWARAKGYDGFCPLGPWISTHHTLDEVADLMITTTLDGEVKQQGSTALMVRSITELVVYITSFTTLLPGDVILTGTPAGVGPMLPGQEVSVTVDGIGTLTNLVTRL